MATPEQTVIDKLDGRNSDAPGRPTLPWRLTKLYKRVKGWQGPLATPVRKNGGSTNDTPGTEWNTPSSSDELTVLAEILTQVYVDATGKEHTAFDLLVELHQALVEKK